MTTKENMIVVAIVNAGFAEDVMEAATTAGAKGGTIINARGSAKKEAENIFNITITPDKEIVLIIVKNEIVSDILHAIYKKVGLNSPGNGIAFSIPADEVVGIKERQTNNQNEVAK